MNWLWFLPAIPGLGYLAAGARSLYKEFRIGWPDHAMRRQGWAYFWIGLVLTGLGIFCGLWFRGA